MKTCGTCKWWHDDSGLMDPAGVRRCYALPYPEVLFFQSTAAATCIIPDRYEESVQGPTEGQTRAD